MNVCEKTSRYVPNPDYLTFKDSPYYKPEFQDNLNRSSNIRELVTSIDQHISYYETDSEVARVQKRIFVISSIQKGEYLDDIPMDLQKRLYEELNRKPDTGMTESLLKAKEDYNNSIISRETIFMFTSDILDNHCFVSSSGDGDGSYVCYTATNEDGFVVSVMIDYYPNYPNTSESDDKKLEIHTESKHRNYVIFAVDFDNTLCASNFPDTGKPNRKLIRFLRNEHEKGNKIILWTCRCGEILEKAVQWCKDYHIPIDAVNDNIPEIIEQWNGVNSRKVHCDYYIDDKSETFDLDVPFHG
jgi:hypothetical protein